MADLVTGAMGSLIPKLVNVLKEEYGHQAGTEERIKNLTMELKGAQAALEKVAEVPWDQLDEQVKLWACELRESSYDMEDFLDTYHVRVKGPDSAKQKKKGSLKRLGEKVANLFNKSKARREISIGVNDIETHLDEVTKRWSKFKVDDIVARPATASMVDPRLAAMYNKVKNLVGIDKSSGELISMLQNKQSGDKSNTKMKIVSVVGVGGLGKTTLAKAVYDKLIGDFQCGAFVPVGRSPDLKKVIQEILIRLDKQKYMQFNFALFNEIHEFIDELKDFLLENKRYFIVVDDIWEVQSWDTIKLAIDDDNNCGGRIMVTTRNLEVATKADEVYRLQPLPRESSRELFCARISDNQVSYNDDQPDEVFDKILKKCGGIPLAIITMASLLVGKPRDKWLQLYNNIGFGHKDSKEAENTMRILSFSYYDLPAHLRTCLLYLCAFPEDSVIHKHSLIWKWVAEGFVQEKKGTRLIETAEGYFNDLMNKSLIQAVEGDEDVYDGTIIGCRVHDIVLDFIRSMSHKENFLTILDNDQDTPLHNHARRLTYHNRTVQNSNHLDDMRKVRSFSAEGCTIESWAPLSSFTLLRVLDIQDCKKVDSCPIRIEDVGQLLHLRYLNLRGTKIEWAPGGLGALRCLQTLYLDVRNIAETPSNMVLPPQLVNLRISFKYAIAIAFEVAWMERLTSLEELLVIVDEKFKWKELPRLRELRVLAVSFWGDEVERERECVESVSCLENLQHLTLAYQRKATWQAAGFVLPRQLRHLVVWGIYLLKLPPCINPSSLPNLAHLDLRLKDVDEQDLKNLGGLPELYFLKLDLDCSAAISNINSGMYFPKLRCFKLRRSMVLFVANKDDTKKVSFHIWDGESDITVPSDSDENELQGPLPSFAASSGENKEDYSVFAKGAGAGPRFMPNLQALHFRVVCQTGRAHGYCDNYVGWKYLSSLREIKVDLWDNKDEVEEAAAVALRRAADEHPNRPSLRIW
ncbi:hypothetical protein U9M48_037054 [Paspalum notatum var. saurae]|uniref:AAA+ ATPase domain-containing protein n=1 Tax=Paspalum notatum var. saurae TaxID=547442 RepID=A0AAQ3UIH6_PASNO